MPSHKERADKAVRTHAAATAIIDGERLAREKKTARLRSLRLAKKAVETPSPRSRRK